MESLSTNSSASVMGSSTLIENELVERGYNLDQQLLSNPSSTVFLATKDNHKCVVKVQEKSVVNINDEINILRRLQGVRGVIQYIDDFDFAVCEGCLNFPTTFIAIVTEYVPGTELYTRILKGRLSEKTARNIFYNLLLTMNKIHEMGIVHRDLKPENIIISTGGLPVIVDWGMAFEPLKTNLRVSCGSPHYASPEAISGGQYDGPELDVWSLGCTLYVMLTAQMPFYDEHIPAMFSQIKRCKVNYYVTGLDPGAVSLLRKIFVLNNRTTIKDLLKNEWL